MGDPLTKCILHLINISVRTLSAECGDPVFYENVATNPNGAAAASQLKFE